jgi:hypothetical protein
MAEAAPPVLLEQDAAAAVTADETGDAAVYPLGAEGGDAVRALLLGRGVFPGMQMANLLVSKVGQVAEAGPHLAKERRGW